MSRTRWSRSRLFQRTQQAEVRVGLCAAGPGGLWRYEIALDAGEGATALVAHPAIDTASIVCSRSIAPHRCPQGEVRFQRTLPRRRGQRQSPAMAGYLATSLSRAASRFRGRHVCSTSTMVDAGRSNPIGGLKFRSLEGAR
jgi:hypothetical protein